MKMRDLYLIIISVVISVVTNLYITGTPTKIVTIDEGDIFRDLIIAIQQETKADNEEVLEEKTKKYQGIRDILNKRLARIAQEKNFIILSKKDVIGGEDLTRQAQLLLEDLVKEGRVDAEVQE